MIFDRNLMFSIDQAVTFDAASSDFADLGPIAGRAYGAAAVLGRDTGRGGEIGVAIQVTETFTALTSLRIVIQASDDPTFASGVRDLQENTLPRASLIAGAVSSIQSVPAGASARYLRLFYDVTGTTPSAGRITAGVVASNR